MQVALLGDVHANLLALQAVLAHAEQHGFKAAWNVGDFVGYGPFPDQVVQLLRKNERVLSIVGNYDLRVLEFPQKKPKWRKKQPREQYLSFKWTFEQLGKKNRSYLHFLSQELRFKVKGWRVLLTHGSPESNEEALTPDTPKKRLQQLARLAKANVIVCGHSHRPFVRQVDDVWFINPGSVGRPDDGDPRASYALLQIEAGQLQVEHYRVEYDVQQTAESIRQQKLPEAFAQMILQGRSLQAVLAGSGDAD